MKAKKVIFDVKDIEEAQSGYKLEVDIQASPYEKAILKEIKKHIWISTSDITDRYGYPDRSIGSNLARMERLGILKSKWDWRKARDGRLRKYHLYTLKK